MFYATASGESSAELNTTVCEGIYTSILHDALNGQLYSALGTEAAVLQMSDQPGDAARYVWSYPLSEYLKMAVKQRIADLKLNVNQEPDDEIPGGHGSWLARIPAGVFGSGLPTLGPPTPTVRGIEDRAIQPVPLEEAITVGQAAKGLLDAIEAEPATPLARHLDRARQAPASGVL